MGGDSDHRDSLSSKPDRYMLLENLLSNLPIVCHIYSEKCRLEMKYCTIHKVRAASENQSIEIV